MNQWIGHTQEVAEAHYTQNLASDFIDAHNAESAVTQTVAQSTGMGVNHVESEKMATLAIPFYAASCDVTPYTARSKGRGGGTRTPD